MFREKRSKINSFQNPPFDFVNIGKPFATVIVLRWKKQIPIKFLLKYVVKNMAMQYGKNLVYSALLMAGLDGIINRIDPTAEGFGPYDMNIFDLSEEEKKKIKGLPKNLKEALNALMNSC